MEDQRNKLLNFIKAAAEENEVVKYNSSLTNQENLVADSTWVAGLFRIVQELVNNVTNYALVTDVWIKAAQVKNVFSLTTQDNAIGIDIEAAQGASCGLSNIIQRVKIMDGTLTMESGKVERTMCVFKISVR